MSRREASITVEERRRRPTPYDLRQTVRITAPIIGGIGGFVVTAIVLVLQTTPNRPDSGVSITLAAGLLALSLSGCLAGAFSLASLAGERRQTVNLHAAAMYMAAGPTIAIVAILAAFHVLATLYIQDASHLFAMMAAMIGMAGSVYNGTSVVDEWDIAPGRSRWVRSRAEARAWLKVLVVLGAVPVFLGALMFLFGLTVPISRNVVTWHVVVGMAIAVGGGVMGLLRSLHPDDDEDHGLGKWEAIGLQLVMGIYIGSILVFLPR